MNAKEFAKYVLGQKTNTIVNFSLSEDLDGKHGGGILNLLDGLVFLIGYWGGEDFKAASIEGCQEDLQIELIEDVVSSYMDKLGAAQIYLDTESSAKYDISIKYTPGINFGEVYQDLTYIKKRYLQLEFLEKECEANAVIKGFSAEIKKHKDMTATELSEMIAKLNLELTNLIPSDLRNDLDFYDSDDYTSKNYGNSFWNEIPHPPIIDTLFEMLAKTFNLKTQESSRYHDETALLKLYDLMGAELFFSDDDELNQFVDENDVSPADAFEWSSKNNAWMATWNI